VGFPAAVLVERVIEAVSQFSGPSRGDDVTVVALRGV
jgi:hypothetical protein